MSRLKFQRREVRYVSVLTVHAPDAYSLIEGMRYDRCCPSTEDESRKIGKLISGTATGDDCIITLFRYAAAPIPATEQRWNSFGCTVIDERDPEAPPLSLDETRLKLAIRQPRVTGQLPASEE